MFFVFILVLYNYEKTCTISKKTFNFKYSKNNVVQPSSNILFALTWMYKITFKYVFQDTKHFLLQISHVFGKSHYMTCSNLTNDYKPWLINQSQII